MDARRPPPSSPPGIVAVTLASIPSVPFPVQEERHFQQFRANVRDVVETNQRNAGSGATWHAGLNQFSDVSFSEFSSEHLGQPTPPEKLAAAAATATAHARAHAEEVEAEWAALARAARSRARRMLAPANPWAGSTWPPKYVNWYAANFTTPVKDQKGVSQPGCVWCLGGCSMPADPAAGMTRLLHPPETRALAPDKAPSLDSPACAGSLPVGPPTSTNS